MPEQVSRFRRDDKQTYQAREYGSLDLFLCDSFGLMPHISIDILLIPPGGKRGHDVTKSKNLCRSL